VWFVDPGICKNTFLCSVLHYNRDNCIVFENFTATMVDVMVANIYLLAPLTHRQSNLQLMPWNYLIIININDYFPYQILAILFGLYGLLAFKKFDIYECYSRNASWALTLLSTFYCTVVIYKLITHILVHDVLMWPCV
jgi:H+/Cl- antiporter ClcA